MIVLLLFACVCCSTAFDVRHHLSTKTTYSFRQLLSTHESGTNINHDAKYLTGIIRHGTRWPTDGTIERYLDIKPFQESSFPWETVYSLAGELHEKGQFELYELAKQLTKTFPSVFDAPYVVGNYLLTSTAKARATASAVAFGMGAFPEVCQLGQCIPQAVAIKQLPKDSDILLRIYKVDEHYKHSQKTLEASIKDNLSRTIYKAIAQRNPKLQAFIKDPEKIENVWETCQMEASLLSNTSDFKFCTLFSQGEIELLEWTEDYAKFLVAGSAHPINCCLSLPLLEHLIQSLEDAAMGKTEEGKYASLYFAHSETILPLACLLGIWVPPRSTPRTLLSLLAKLEINPSILDQSPLLSNDLNKDIWKCGMLSPMTGNVLFSLHSKPGDTESYVRLYWNEELLSGPWCNGKEECSISEFKMTTMDNASQFGSCKCTSSHQASCTATWQLNSQ